MTVAWELTAFIGTFELARVTQLTASAFNELGQYTSSPGYRAYCHQELAVSSLVVTRRPSPVLIPPTHGEMARLS